MPQPSVLTAPQVKMAHAPLMPINQLHLPVVAGFRISLNFNITEHNATLRYIGVHQFIPGISSTTMADSLIIGQDAWVSFVGVDALETTANTWIVNFDNLEGKLQALRASQKRTHVFKCPRLGNSA